MMKTRRAAHVGSIVAFGLSGVVVMLGAGCDIEERPNVNARQEHILNGDRAPFRSGVARVSHRDSAYVCSGTVIAQSWVVTAKHCVFQSASGMEQPLPADGFRVEVGRDDEPVMLHYVDAVRWIGSTDTTVIESVEAGEDIALLRLTEPVSLEVELISVRPSYLPRDRDDVVIVGFGIGNLDTGVAGIRREGEGFVTGFEPETGVIQLEGSAACFGDSGGPVLLSSDNTLVGVISRVAGTSDAGFCEPGISFASSIANARVRNLLLVTCEMAGRCGPEPDAGEEMLVEDSGSPREEPPAEAGAQPPMEDAGSGDASMIMPRRHRGGECSVALEYDATGLRICYALLFVALAWRRRCPIAVR